MSSAPSKADDTSPHFIGMYSKDHRGKPQTRFINVLKEDM